MIQLFGVYAKGLRERLEDMLLERLSDTVGR
jgi:hypothetical protein